MQKRWLATALLCITPVVAQAAIETKPKLVLQLTVDGLRGDLLARYQHNFGEGGFNYLLKEGVHYTNAHYQHGNTETIVGHVSLATGAPPAVHGMVGNVWYDRQLERIVYNVEDETYPLLTADAGVDQDTEIDPTQKAAKVEGRSPTPILSSTFSDELHLSNNGSSRIFSVSVKDRGAISLAGHTGKAFWFSKASSQFITSSYYYDQIPQWVNRWNEKSIPQQYSKQRWELTLPKEQYTQNELMSEHKFDLGGFARTFPHPYGPASYQYFSTMLTVSPAGDEITADFAQTLLLQEKLGQGDVPDYLAVSFSSNDYVIHLYGPESLETEDNLIRLDKTIAKLLKSIDNQIGLENTLIVLSADHGVPESAPVSQVLGFRGANYIDTSLLVGDAVKQRLSEQFQLDESAIRLYSHPYIYLNQEVITSSGADLTDVQRAVADEVSKLETVFYAAASQDIERNQIPNNRLGTLIQNNHHALRSGDVYVVMKPRNYMANMGSLTTASTHGSPWRYDTHVPVIFAGMDIQGKKVSREVTPYDVAPTLSHYLGITHPSGSIGQVLEEVVSQ
jgi:predicted AlkP superfamily pyrophosphatase or phosphodiesterase